MIAPGLAQDDLPLVRARAFHLVDEAGSIRAELGFDGDSPRIALRDEPGPPTTSADVEPGEDGRWEGRFCAACHRRFTRRPIDREAMREE